MNAIVLYGPPASGKYTIGKQLAEDLQYKFLHNHAIFDLASQCLDKTTDSYWDFCWKLRKDIIEEGIREKVPGMIITRAGTDSKKEQLFFSDMHKMITASGGRLAFIVLSCDDSKLEDRVQNKSRKQFTKVQSVDELENWISRHGNDNIPSGQKVLTLYNNGTASQAVEKAKELLSKVAIK